MQMIISKFHYSKELGYLVADANMDDISFGIFVDFEDSGVGIFAPEGADEEAIEEMVLPVFDYVCDAVVRKLAMGGIEL